MTDRRGWEEGKWEKGEEGKGGRRGAGFETQQGWQPGGHAAQPHGRATPCGSSSHTSAQLQQAGGGGVRKQLCQCRKRAPERESGWSTARAYTWRSWQLHQSVVRKAYACPLQQRGLRVTMLALTQAAGRGWGGLAPSSQELFPVPTRLGPSAQGVLYKGEHSQASPRHALEDPLAFPAPMLAFAAPMSVSPVSPREPFLIPFVSPCRAGREYFFPIGGGGNTQGKHCCPITLTHALAQPRPALLTWFPPNRLSTPVSHPMSSLLSSSATHGSLALAPMASQAASPVQAHLLLFPLPLCFFLFPFPCSPPFYSPPPVCLCLRISSRLCTGSLSHPACPPTSPMFKLRCAAAHCISPGWIPPGLRSRAPAPHVQPPGSGAVLRHS